MLFSYAQDNKYDAILIIAKQAIAYRTLFFATVATNSFR